MDIRSYVRTVLNQNHTLDCFLNFFPTVRYRTGSGAVPVQKGIPNFLKKIKTCTYLRTVLNQNHTLVQSFLFSVPKNQGTCLQIS